MKYANELQNAFKETTTANEDERILTINSEANKFTDEK